MQFQKGNAGKAKGTLDRKWYSILHWYNELRKDWPLLTPNQRANYSIELMKMLAAKSKSIPSDPTDSSFNAEEAMKELDRIAPLNQPKL